MTIIFLLMGTAFQQSAHAAAVNFSGQLGVVDVDAGGAIYSGVPLGTVFSGSIDDVTFNGSISDGSTLTPFSCCIAAGGLGIENDAALSASDAALLNALTGTLSFNSGDIFDGIDVEGDIATAGGGRIEVGLSYLFDASTFADTDPANYPFNPNDVLVALFFIIEEDASDQTIYAGAGLLNAVPLPAALPLYGTGLAVLGFIGWRRKRIGIAKQT